MYFIFDCNGVKVGNTKGYHTFKGAERQQNMVGSPAYNAIWIAYYLHVQPSDLPELVCSIKFKE